MALRIIACLTDCCAMRMCNLIVLPAKSAQALNAILIAAKYVLLK